MDVIDKEATLTARQYKNEIQNRFHDFVMDDRELALEVEQVYNECFNNYVLQQYDLPTFDVYPGASSVIDGKPFILREHQKRAVTRCIQGNSLLAHAVGAGKTAVMITAAMELIRLKLATKTMIVVHRQGNILPEVEVIRYGMAETLDAGMYQILTRKQKFINDALKGKRRNMDEINDTSIDFASFSAQISGNPKLIRKVEVETRLRELQSLEYQFRRSVRRDEDLKSELERAIPRMEEDIERMKELAAYPFPTDFPQIEINGIALEGTPEYRVKQLANHLTSKGIYQAIQHARREREDASIDLGYAKINGIEIELKAVCPFEIYRAREDQAVIRYRLAGESFYNGRIRVGSDVTTGSGLITSLKSVLDAKAKEAVGEAESLELNRQRLKQLAETEGKRVFKYADERIEFQKELDKLLFELNELDLLHEDRRIEVMPRLSDYLDLGVEVIAEKIEITDESDEEDAEEEDAFEKSA